LILSKGNDAKAATIFPNPLHIPNFILSYYFYGILYNR